MQKIIKFEQIRKFKINRVKLSIILILLFIIILKSQSKLITTYFDSFLKNLGFSLTEVIITGANSLDESEIKKHIQYRNCSNLFCINLTSTKNSLEKLNLIKDANIELVLPSKLKIKIFEEKPSFVLDNGSSAFLLNSNGKKIANIGIKNELYNNLVLVRGENVVDKIRELKIILEASPDLAKKITSARLISNRRWSLVVSYLTTIELPEKNPSVAFKKLGLLNKRYGLLSDNLKKIDLRVKNRMIIKFNIGDYVYQESKV